MTAGNQSLECCAKDFNIDLSRSIMLGDGKNDVKAGLSAGCKSVLIDSQNINEKQELGEVQTVDSVLTFVKKYLIVSHIL